LETRRGVETLTTARLPVKLNDRLDVSFRRVFPALFMIQLVHVSKTYAPGIRALINVNVKIDRGEFVFLTGPSGAGKTTLLKLLFRQEEPSAGQVVIADKNVSHLNARGVARLRQKLGLVFQEFKLLPSLTALENVALAAQVVGDPQQGKPRQGAAAIA
jgi:cell division transport system ATP-binding protein